MLHQIGVGALGPVFRTYEPERDRLVAVKAFKLDITPETAVSLADELSRAAEAGLFHPSIVEPIAAGVEGSLAYNAEEYVAAESLDAAMRRHAPAPLESVLPLMTQLAGAIDFARAAGIGHGALHPRDIFMTDDEVRATGFGVVESLERVGIRAPIRRPYSAPERIAGAAWGTEADVFALAVVTYELLTGRRPAGLGSEIGPLTAGVPDAPLDALHKVLARAMHENPGQRYSTALAFASALEAAARGEGSRAVVAASAPPAAAIAPAVSDRLAPAEHTAADEPEDVDEGSVEDVAIERDEDEAHHQLTLQESEAGDQGDGEMDADSAAEAEADRYAADDFLLGAAGAASAPADLGSLDDFADTDPDLDRDRRALADDEVALDEPSPAVFEPSDRIQPAEDVHRVPAYSAAAASLDLSGRSQGHSRAREDFRSAAVATDHVAANRRRWPAALFVVGLTAGIAAGYLLWGRGSLPPAAREYSEATVPSATAGRAPETPDAVGRAPERADTGGPGLQTPAGQAPPDQTAKSDAVGGAPQTPARETRESRSGAAAPAPGPQRGTLVVRSTPDNAGVTVNGRWRGRTPLTLDDLPFARYDVRVVQPGFTTAQEAVLLSAAEPRRDLAFRLQSRPNPPAATAARPSPARAPERAAPTSYTGSVYVDSRPRGAKVFIDGKSVGVTPLSVPDIGIGSHVVRLELPDHRIWSSATRVVSGETVRVTGSLERIQ